jgi:antitoxin component of MazEF toxin-antitoxin module
MDNIIVSKRKLQKSYDAISSYVYLPKEWLKENNLKKGNKVGIIAKGTRLTLIAGSDRAYPKFDTIEGRNKLKEEFK